MLPEEWKSRKFFFSRIILHFFFAVRSKTTKWLSGEESIQSISFVSCIWKKELLYHKNIVSFADIGWDKKADRTDKNITDAVNIWVRLKPPLRLSTPSSHQICNVHLNVFPRLICYLRARQLYTNFLFNWMWFCCSHFSIEVVEVRRKNRRYDNWKVV